MKIKEILTEEELKDCSLWGVLYDAEKIEGRLINHYPEMELKDFLLFEILQELEDIKYGGIGVDNE